MLHARIEYVQRLCCPSAFHAAKHFSLRVPCAPMGTTVHLHEGVLESAPRMRELQLRNIPCKEPFFPTTHPNHSMGKEQHQAKGFRAAGQAVDKSSSPPPFAGRPREDVADEVSRNTIEQLEVELLKKGRQVQEAQGQVAALQEKMQAKAAEVEAALAARGAEVESVTSALAARCTELDAMRKELDGCELTSTRRIAELETALAARVKETEDMKTVLVEREKRVDGLRNSLTAQKGVVTKARAELATAMTELATRTSELEAVRKKMAEMAKRDEEMEEKRKASYDSFKEEMERLRRMADDGRAAEARMRDLLATQNAQTKTIEALQRTIELMDNNKASVKQEEAAAVCTMCGERDLEVVALQDKLARVQEAAVAARDALVAALPVVMPVAEAAPEDAETETDDD